MWLHYVSCSQSFNTYSLQLQMFLQISHILALLYSLLGVYIGAVS